MTDKERTAAIAFLSNLINHDAEAWGYEQEIPIFKTALEALTRPDWTPCAEGFPTVKETVLATIADGFGNDIMLAWYDGDSWQDGYKNKIPVIAWQPLPEPYNPDRKEDAK